MIDTPYQLFCFLFIVCVLWLLFHESGIQMTRNVMHIMNTNRIDTLFENIQVLRRYNNTYFDKMKTDIDLLENGSHEDKQKRYMKLRSHVAYFRLSLPEDEFILSTFDKNISLLFADIEYTLNERKII